ncbi:hypothetical protein APR04_002733 [Promicromonospora umidemergens]|nr:hypothetical protein [Promicromonospora umidemergens]
MHKCASILDHSVNVEEVAAPVRLAERLVTSGFPASNWPGS